MDETISFMRGITTDWSAENDEKNWKIITEYAERQRTQDQQLAESLEKKIA